MEGDVIMETYEEVANSYGLEGETKERYLEYMKTRWPHKWDEKIKCKSGYAGLWAERFKLGIEYEASDIMGQNVLKVMDRKDRKENIGVLFTVFLSFIIAILLIGAVFFL